MANYGYILTLSQNRGYVGETIRVFAPVGGAFKFIQGQTRLHFQWSALGQPAATTIIPGGVNFINDYQVEFEVPPQLHLNSYEVQASTLVDRAHVAGQFTVVPGSPPVSALAASPSIPSTGPIPPPGGLTRKSSAGSTISIINVPAHLSQFTKSYVGFTTAVVPSKSTVLTPILRLGTSILHRLGLYSPGFFYLPLFASGSASGGTGAGTGSGSGGGSGSGSSGVPIGTGSGDTKVDFLLDGKEFFNTLLDELNRVKNSHGDGYVHLAYWRCILGTKLDDFNNNTNPVLIEDLLKNIADAGHSIKIILWDSGHLAGFFNIYQGVQRDNEAFKNALDGYANGRIQVILENYGSTGMSQHQKIAICSADGDCRVLIGGYNLRNKYWDHIGHDGTYPNKWHDTAVRLTGPATDPVEQEFNRRWNDHASTTAEGPTATNAQTGGFDVDIAITDYENGPRRDIHSQFLAAIAQAQDYIYIENFAVVDSAIIQAIVNRLKQQPQLRVIIVISKPANHSNPNNREASIYSYLHYLTFVELAYATCARVKVHFPYGSGPSWISRDPGRVWLTTHSDYVGSLGEMNNNDWLTDSEIVWGRNSTVVQTGSNPFAHIIEFDGGVRLYCPLRMTSSSGGSPIYVHSKLAMIDDEICFIGSANFNYRSMLYDAELDAIIHGSAKVIEIKQRLLDEYNMTDFNGWHQQAISNKQAMKNNSATPNQIGIINLDLEDFVRTSPPYAIASLFDDRTWY